MAKVTPLASAPIWVTLGVPGGSGGPATAPLNVAVTVTLTAVFIVTTQAPVPEQAPLQPANEEPAAGEALRVTDVPGVKDCEQVAPQLMPAGALVTVPEPLPLLVTDKVIVVAPVADPLTAREKVSPLAEKVTLPANVPTVLGANRTVTA
jgi:hypothetical protein